MLMGTYTRKHTHTHTISYVNHCLFIFCIDDYIPVKELTIEFCSSKTPQSQQAVLKTIIMPLKSCT